MKVSNLLFIVVLSIGAYIFIYIFSLKEKQKINEISFLKDKELILKKRIKDLTRQKREKVNLSSIHNFNDSEFNSLEDRLKKTSSLILLIPEEPCRECITKEYRTLKKLPAIIQDKIIFITNFKKTRDIKVFLNLYKIDYPLYNSRLPIFNNFKDSKNSIIFILDSSYIPQHIFLPVSFMPELTDDYFTFLVSDFFNIKKKAKEELAKSIIKKSKHDFGELKLHEKVETIFEITNVSATPLIISDIKPDCGCTAVNWERKPVPNRGKAFISVQYRADNIGFFSKRIFVFSNAINSPNLFIIKGKVNN